MSWFARTIGFLALFLALGAQAAFVVGLWALSEGRDVPALYWLLVAAWLLKAGHEALGVEVAG